MSLVSAPAAGAGERRRGPASPGVLGHGLDHRHRGERVPGHEGHRLAARWETARAASPAHSGKCRAAYRRAFAQDGLSVPVAEIARRAGVGTGTVSRHFPTKEALYQAIVLSRVEQLVDRAHDLAKTRDLGTAFFEFFAFLVEQGAANRGLAQALAGGGFDIEAAAGPYRTRPGRCGAALVLGCLAREQRTADPAARQRVIAVVCGGLRT
ncbi:MAG: TetR/AcrR family transcriptional regulator [Natronosporangium sp.]